MSKKKVNLTKKLFNDETIVSANAVNEEKINNEESNINMAENIIPDKYDEVAETTKIDNVYEENEDVTDEITDEVKNDNTEECVQENENVSSDDIDTINEEMTDEKEILEENEEIAKVVKPIKSIKKIGFNDESYYFNDLK